MAFRRLFVLPLFGILAMYAPASADATGSDDGPATVVAINGSADATASSQVTVTVPSPSNDFGDLRVSDDGGATWVQREWDTSFAWSLTDPAAGGTDADGTHTVTVEGGDGDATWTPIGSASILLDRSGPTVGTASISNGAGPKIRLELPASDAGAGLARTEVSLDDVHWQSLDPSPYNFQNAGVVDVRDGTIGGSWQLGDRTIYTRAVDNLGNVTEAAPVTATITNLRSEYDAPISLEFPRAAVAGQPYTVKPVFDPGFQVASNEFCEWFLYRGDAPVRLEAEWDPTYGEVETSVPAKDGVCEPWTFTLPYTPVLEYTVQLGIASGPTEWDAYTDAEAGSFRAAPGDTTSRAITESNLPLVYMLPDRDVVGADNTVNYQLYSVGGASTADGSWFCAPSDGQPQSAWSSQKGGDSFSCAVSTSEPYTAFWARETDMEWRAGYDPLGMSAARR